MVFRAMIEKVKAALNKHGMLAREDRVVVAVSGGADSMALLKALEILSREYGISLVSAHLNHGIRENADPEEQFVRRFSQDRGIPFESKRVHVPGLQKGAGKSIEEIGREERIRFLMDAASKYGAQKIALGHHLHDQAETVIMNFLRGSGTQGLKGMSPVRDGLFIRPLLGIKKKEILAFLEENQVPYMTDPSNDSKVYLRNRIRHELLPELKKQFNPKLEETLGNMSEVMRLENDYLEAVTDKVLESWGVKTKDEEIRIKRYDLINLHPAIQNRIIKTLLKRFNPSGKGIGYVHIKAVINLARSCKPGGQVILPFRICLRREYDYLCFVRQEKEDSERRGGFCYAVSIPGEIRMNDLDRIMRFEMVQPPESILSNNPDMVYMDFEKITPPLVVRTIKPGDCIEPLGMAGKKKLKSYFIDSKIPQIKRKHIPLLADGESVIWIAGMMLSERVKITNKTRIFLKIEII
jgi:tRNA(Ile)-lysidine synthase